jgi:hypothetical protein
LILNTPIFSPVSNGKNQALKIKRQIIIATALPPIRQADPH